MRVIFPFVIPQIPRNGVFSTQQTRHMGLMLEQCWANVVDGGPTLVQHWIDVLCLLGILLPKNPSRLRRSPLIFLCRPMPFSSVGDPALSPPGIRL